MWNTVQKILQESVKPPITILEKFLSAMRGVHDIEVDGIQYAFDPDTDAQMVGLVRNARIMTKFDVDSIPCNAYIWEGGEWHTFMIGENGEPFEVSHSSTPPVGKFLGAIARDGDRLQFMLRLCSAPPAAKLVKFGDLLSVAVCPGDKGIVAQFFC